MLIPANSLGRRALLLCAVLWYGALLRPLGAQSGGPTNRVGSELHRHRDSYPVAPPPPQIFDGALTTLAAELHQVKLKSGTLDVDGLIEAIRPALQKFKPPERLELDFSGSCNIVDPQDRGGYWASPNVSFVEGDKDYISQLNLEGNWKAFPLAKPPILAVKYSLTGMGFDEGSDRPFRRNVRLRADYYIVARVTVTFDQEAITITRESQPVASGAASQAPADHTFAATISLTDSGDFPSSGSGARPPGLRR